MKNCPKCKSTDIIQANQKASPDEDAAPFWIVCGACGFDGPPAASAESARFLWDALARSSTSA